LRKLVMHRMHWTGERAMIEGIPTWAWVLFIIQVFTLYNVLRVGKALDSNYERIMRQLRPDVYEEEW